MVFLPQPVSGGAFRLKDGLADDVGVGRVELPGSGRLAVAHLHHWLVALFHRLIRRLLLERDLMGGRISIQLSYDMEFKNTGSGIWSDSMVG